MQPTEFSSLQLNPDLIAVLGEIGFQSMTPIQAQSIPLLLNGHDLIGQSQTGSGKTVAFSLPILEKLNMESREVQALVLCPTRELCTQVARDMRRLGRKYKGLQVLILCGGMPGRPQFEALQAGAQIVVGTPGRVLDFIRRRRLDLRYLSTLVLDEADRMLDMGFEEDMSIILDEAPRMRQTVFFSATFPDTIENMSRRYQHAPSRVTIEATPAEKPSIEQLAFIVHNDEKLEALMKLMVDYKPESAIVFCNLKATVAELSERLQKEGISAQGLYGDLEQSDRDRVMALFRNGSTRILVATDVAARGLDVEALQMVINYDFPNQSDSYLHRIGRTGRAGRTGLAITLVTQREIIKLAELESLTGERIEPKPLESRKPHEFGRNTTIHESAMRTLQISGGRKDKVRPGDILGALTGEAGLKGADVGKIEIHDRFSYVAISRSVADLAADKLRRGQIKGRKFFVDIVD